MVLVLVLVALHQHPFSMPRHQVFMPWHCRCSAVFLRRLVPALVCLVSLLLPLVAHGMNFSVSARVDPAAIGLGEELFKDGFDGLRAAFLMWPTPGDTLGAVPAARAFPWCSRCQEGGGTRRPLPSSGAGGAQVVADVERVVVHALAPHSESIDSLTLKTFPRCSPMLVTAPDLMARLSPQPPSVPLRPSRS